MTLCFLIRGDEICLAMKKVGFGTGNWNGVGGKVEANETIAEAAVREVSEEIGVTAKVDDLKFVGDIKFFFNDQPEWNQQMFIYFLDKWEGEPSESDEMAPKWFPQSQLPYAEMWSDDKYWLPIVLAGRKIKGEFYFADQGKTIAKYTVKELVEEMGYN